MSAYAQIPTNLICRFGELSKTEIRVFTYLYAVRNRRTGQCNPSQKTISDATGIPKSHVSSAIKTLAQKGWIDDGGEGHFLLEDPRGKVTDSVTERDAESYGIRNFGVTDSVTPESQKVTDSVTKVTDSVTESYGFRNSHIKDSEQRFEQKKNREREGRPRAEDFAPPIGPTMKANHPALVAVRSLTGHQPDRATWDGIIDALGSDPDLARLAECYSAWVMRGYRKANYGWITDWYASPEWTAQGGPPTSKPAGRVKTAREFAREAEAMNRPDDVEAKGVH
jgi:hypothetical protein